MYSVGIIGCGVIGQRLAQAFDIHPDIMIIAVCDIDRKKVDELSKKYKSLAYTSYQSMIDESDLDIIYVGIPPKYHCCGV